MKKLLQVMIAVLLVGGISPALNVSANEGQVLRLAVPANPETLDPTTATEVVSGTIIHNIYEGLTAIDAVGKVQPAVAESWEVSEDGLTYTFKLDPAAKWNNGDSVTAGDFEYSWKRALNPETLAKYAILLYPIKGAEAYNTGEGSVDDVAIKAVDDQTLEVELSHPTPYFTSMIGGSMVFYPVHQATVEATDGWKPTQPEDVVTNGAFNLESLDFDVEYVLTKNPDYRDADVVQIDGAQVRIIDSDTTINAEYQSGNLDFYGSPFGGITPDAVDLYRSQDQLHVTEDAASYNIKLNTTDPQLSNANIRKALGHAVDRKSLVEHILKGGQPVALSIVHPSIPGFANSALLKDADFDAAKEYLAKGLEELGLKDPSELDLTISINTSETHSVIAQHLQEGWRQHLGINVDIENTEFQVYLENVANLNYQIGRMGKSADYADANAFLEEYKYVDNGINRTGWHNEEYTDLLNKADQETDADQRLEYLHQAEAILMDEMPVFPVYYYVNSYVLQDNVKNMAPDIFGRVLLKHVVIE